MFHNSLKLFYVLIDLVLLDHTSPSQNQIID